MELVLKTSDPHGPGVRIPLSPPISPMYVANFCEGFNTPNENLQFYMYIDVTTWRSTQVGDEAPLLRA